MEKRVWITGAGKGIGRAVAERLAMEGNTVAVSARSIEDLESLVSAFKDGPGKIVSYPLDVTDADAHRFVFETIEKDLGSIDQVILNAGTHAPTPSTNFDLNNVRRLINVNLLGVANGLAAIMPRFIERQAGRIAVVASVAGYSGLPSAAAYGATKAALINMCEALRPELAADGIILQVVNPGFVKTPLTDQNDFPMPFLMPVDVAAKRFVDGLKTDRFEITFPRRFAAILKMLRCLPYPLYFALTKKMVKR